MAGSDVGESMATPLPRVVIGDIEIVALVGGRLRLDGGAMFGVVPRPLWERVAPPDDRHRIQMASTPLLVRAGGRQIVVDVGIGDKYDDRWRDRFAIVSAPLPDLLTLAGSHADAIDTVVCTHLHWDHAGGATWRDTAGRLRPTFPRADHLVQRREWRDAQTPTERNQASYVADDFRPLADAGRLVLVEGEIEIAPGIRTVHLGGHTAALQGVLIQTPAGGLLAVNDLVPTIAHLPYPYVMGYDLYPLDTLARRKALLPRAVAEGWIVAFVHDPGVTFAQLVMDEQDRVRMASVLG